MTGLKVTVLGGSGTYPAAGSASSGFLISSNSDRVWVDAGTGTFANLQRHADPFELKALVLSHLHLDHILDIYPLYYALRFSPETRGPFGFKILAPQGAEDYLNKLVTTTGNDGFGGYFDFDVIKQSDVVKLGDLEFEFHRSRHPIEAYGMKVRAAGRTLFYTSDTAPSDSLIEAAEGADVMIAEASMQKPTESLAEVHMTAAEAGELAKKAGVGRLVLTHIVPGQDPRVSVDQAAEAFHGEVISASDNLAIDI